MLTGLQRKGEELSETFNKETENMKKNKSELKNTITEIKNTLQGISSTLGYAEGHISDLEDRLMESTKMNSKKKIIFKKMRIG